jgi:hypothetical protein
VAFELILRISYYLIGAEIKSERCLPLPGVSNASVVCCAFSNLVSESGSSSSSKENVSYITSGFLLELTMKTLPKLIEIREKELKKIE